MDGIRYVIDESGRKAAVLIDLDQWGELWEDFYDTVLSDLRKDEPTVSLEDLEREAETDEHRIG